MHLSTWPSGKHERKAIRQLCVRLLVQLCYFSLNRASEGKRDGGMERAFPDKERQMDEEAESQRESVSLDLAQ